MRGHYDDERDLNDDDWAVRIVGELCGEPVDRSAVNRVKSRIEALRASGPRGEGESAAPGQKGERRDRSSC